jgi:FlaG/FlaF family flagellin (archaellin)
MHISTYAFSENKLISFVELEGLEAAAVPNWIRIPYTAAANSLFQATFANILAKNLIQHFSYGNGKSLSLTQKGMKDVNALKTGIQGVTSIDKANFKNILSRMKTGTSQNINLNITGAALNSGTLGRFRIEFNGILNKQEENWTFKGTMQFNDVWDFKTKKTDKGDVERSEAGNFMTMIGDMYLPGKGFKINSEKVNVSQSSSDDSVDFFKGKQMEPQTNKIMNYENEF